MWKKQFFCFVLLHTNSHYLYPRQFLVALTVWLQGGHLPVDRSNIFVGIGKKKKKTVIKFIPDFWSPASLNDFAPISRRHFDGILLESFFPSSNDEVAAAVVVVGRHDKLFCDYFFLILMDCRLFMNNKTEGKKKSVKGKSKKLQSLSRCRTGTQTPVLLLMH